MPCCQDSPQHGEWTFPNEASVTDSETFRVNRDNNGNVNLSRVSSHVMSPTGKFCCDIEGATGISANAMLCVFICEFVIIHFYKHSPLFKFSVSIQVSGNVATPMAGRDYVLMCNVSGISVNTYEWSKGSAMLSQNGSTLSFYPLRLSDAGCYCCSITVNGLTYSDDQDVNITSK